MISIGNNEISGLYVGSTPVQSVYVGSTQVWSAESWKTVWEAQTIYKLIVRPTGQGGTSTQSGYLSTITNPIPSDLLKAGKKVRITLAYYSSTTTEEYKTPGTSDINRYKMSNSSHPSSTPYEFEIPTTVGNNYFNLRINSDEPKAYVTRIYFNVKSDGTADLSFYGQALRGSGMRGNCYGPAVKITKIEQYY